MKIWDVNVDNIVFSKLIETKPNSKYLIGYLDKVIRPLLVWWYLKVKVKDGDKDKNKLMSFCIDDEKLLEKYEAIQAKIEDLINIELNTLPVYDDRYIKTKIRTYGDKVYTNVCSLNVSEEDIECESFTVFLLILYLYMTTNTTLPLDNCAVILILILI